MSRYIVYVGTDVSSAEGSGADGSGGGIYVYELDRSDGRLTQLQQVAADGPSFLVLSPSRNMLYAACRGERFEKDGVGGVVSYAIDSTTGMLTPVDEVRVPVYPVYISLDRTESFALVACAFAGSVAVVPLGDAGALKEPTCVAVHDDGPSIVSQGITSAMLGNQRWWSADSVLPHSVIADPTNRYVVACDVGLNRIVVYRFDVEAGTLSPNSPPWAEGAPIDPDLPTRNRSAWASPRGAGPRHLCFNSTGDRLYVINEQGSTVSTFSYDAAAGALEMLQDISTLPAGSTIINSAADVHLHPSGGHLYASNRGHDSLAIYTVDPVDGVLELVGHSGSGGKRPRSFTISPDGTWLLVANLSSNSISVMRFDTSTGLPDLAGTTTIVPSPTCVRILTLGP